MQCNYSAKYIKDRVCDDIWNNLKYQYKKSKSDAYIFSLIIIYYITITYNMSFMYTIKKNKFMAIAEDRYNSIQISYYINKNKNKYYVIS